MQFRDTIQGATGFARSAAIATGNRVKSLTSQLTERLSPWMTVLAGLASAGFGILQSTVATAIERMEPLVSRVAEFLRPWIARLAERLAPWKALVKDVAAVVADATRTAYEAAAERVRPVVARGYEAAAARVRPLVTRVTDRFGVRMTVVGAATAIFVGSTGSTAWAITSMEGPAGTPAEQDAHTVTVAESIAGVSEDASTTAEQLAAAQEEAQAEAEAAAAEEPAEPERVGGLSELQMANAIAIVEAGDERGLDRQAWAVALATAMQESKFRNYANVNVPESYDYPYQAEGSDHDSVGLFQQRPSSGWGSVEELMDPKTSADKFYNSLENVNGWKDMPVTVAAQTVQVSAFPDAYAQWEGLAWEIVESYEAANS
ncbi:hypothetical protein [Glycomyces tenuis]|uniref:hypothetical protein n=1 Tax=Glycomyces tenuis TaxID=58116 RepID=UPI00040E3929|nr:hypothetical protein [Glycomyces tenuis]